MNRKDKRREEQEGGSVKVKGDDDCDDHYKILDNFEHYNLRGDEPESIEKDQK